MTVVSMMSFGTDDSSSMMVAVDWYSGGMANAATTLMKMTAGRMVIR